MFVNSLKEHKVDMKTYQPQIAEMLHKVHHEIRNNEKSVVEMQSTLEQQAEQLLKQMNLTDDKVKEWKTQAGQYAQQAQSEGKQLADDALTKMLEAIGANKDTQEKTLHMANDLLDSTVRTMRTQFADKSNVTHVLSEVKKFQESAHHMIHDKENKKQLHAVVNQIFELEQKTLGGQNIPKLLKQGDQYATGLMANLTNEKNVNKYLDSAKQEMNKMFK